MKPNSRRGERERRRNAGTGRTGAAVTPLRPDWLPEESSATWKRVVGDLEAAGVPLQAIDAGAIGMYVLTVDETRKAAAAGDTKLAARLGRDALQWAAAIGATPAARARLGIKPQEPIPPNDPWSRFD